MLLGVIPLPTGLLKHEGRRLVLRGRGLRRSNMNRHIELFPSHDPEAYRLRAWIHDNLGNHAEDDRDRRMAQ